MKKQLESTAPKNVLKKENKNDVSGFEYDDEYYDDQDDDNEQMTEIIKDNSNYKHSFKQDKKDLNTS